MAGAKLIISYNGYITIPLIAGFKAIRGTRVPIIDALLHQPPRPSMSLWIPQRYQQPSSRTLSGMHYTYNS